MTSPESPDQDAAALFSSARPPRAADAPVRLRGRIKVEPEDFVVEELPAYEPSGQGDHLYLWIEKRDLSAEDMLQLLARTLKIPRQEIGAAGQKDRWAVTRQWLSVPAQAEERLSELADPRFHLLRVSRHENKLRTGHLRGNAFRIVLRTEDANALDRAEEIAATIRRVGVANFYGDQRFGAANQTLQLGLALLRGETTSSSIPFARRQSLLKLALSAAQSAVFNAVLSDRVAAGSVLQVQQGDVLQRWPTGGPFHAEDVAAEQARLDCRETVITGPMFGPKMKRATGLPGERETVALDRCRLTEEMFTRHKKLTSGTRRPLVVWPDDLTVQSHPAGVELNFALPAGAYATVLLTEFLEAD